MTNSFPQSDKYTYKSMDAGEVARAIDDSGLSLGQICRLLDVDYTWMRDTILRAPKDRDPVTPHIFRLVFMLLAATPNGVEVARMITDAVIDKSDEFDMDQKSSNARQHGKQSGFTVERKSSKI